MAAAARSLFVYYRVAPAELARTVAAVQAMQVSLRHRHCGLQAQVLRRVETAAGVGAAADAQPMVTLMEVYSAVHGVDDACVAEIEAEAARLPSATRAGPRHLELFEPCG